MKSFLLLFIFILYFHSIQAADPFFLNPGKEYGLPESGVYDLFQDKKGFIWIASNDGLARFDGKRYVKYRNAFQTSLPGSNIKEDFLGRIWYENFDGRLYYVENDSLKSFFYSNKSGFFPYCFLHDKLFIIDKEGIQVFSLHTFELIKTIPLVSPDIQFATVVGNTYYATLLNRLIVIDENLKINTLDIKSELTDKLNYIYSFQNQPVFIGKYNKFNSIKTLKKNQFSKLIDINDQFIFQGFSEIKNEIWLLTSSGIMVYNPGVSKNKIKTLFNDLSVSDVLVDLYGNIWISSLNKGIYLVNNLENQFFKSDNISPKKILNTENEFVVFGKSNEIYVYDSTFSKPKIIKEKSNNFDVFSTYYDKEKRVIFQVTDKTYFINELNPADQKISLIPIKQIIKIQENIYGFASTGFLGILNSGNQSLPDYLSEFNLIKSSDDELKVYQIENSERFKSLVFNQNDSSFTYISNNGVFWRSATDKVQIHWKNHPVFGKNIYSFQNTNYLNTTSGLLLRENKRNQFEELNSKLELNENEINFFKIFDNRIVVATEKQILVYLLPDLKKIFSVFYNYNQLNDLLLKNNTLYIAKSDGILKLNILNSVLETKIPAFYISEIQINNQKVKPESGFQLNPDQNNILIHFSVLDYGLPDKIKLQYKINNERWLEINPENRILQFSNLASGDYTISFRLNDFILDEKLSFSIDAYWWQKPITYIVSITLILIIMVLYYRSRIRSINRQNSLEKEKINLEKNLSKAMLSGIKSQMNPHFFYNALNTIQAYIFTDDKQNASDYLVKFSKLTRMILEMSEKEKVLLRDELKAITLYLELEKMRFENNLNFSIFIDSSVDPEFISIPPMIIQPYVENAIKHGLLHKKGDKNLELNFVQSEQYLEITINDNGIGRIKSAQINQNRPDQSKSFSTGANQKRLEILNKEINQKLAIEIIDKPNHSGTKVILRIPLYTKIYEY